MPRAIAIVCTLLLAAVSPAAAQSDPFVDQIVEFTPGDFAGFGADNLPAVIQGPPRGAGERQGSTDVLSLGNGGSITLRFDEPVICDGDGIDFTIFENAFLAGTLTFAEIAFVEVSQDGENFIPFPFDEETWEGAAGRSPVLSNQENGIDPLDPAVSGGDLFDLATIGLDWASYVRITDAGDTVDDPGNAIPPGTSAGFDLDAIAIVHRCSSAATATPTIAASATPTATAPPPQADAALVIREIFDGDGNRVADSGGGSVDGSAADLQADGLITAADLVAAADQAAR